MIFTQYLQTSSVLCLSLLFFLHKPERWRSLYTLKRFRRLCSLQSFRFVGRMSRMRLGGDWHEQTLNKNSVSSSLRILGEIHRLALFSELILCPPSSGAKGKKPRTRPDFLKQSETSSSTRCLSSCLPRFVIIANTENNTVYLNLAFSLEI